MTGIDETLPDAHDETADCPWSWKHLDDEAAIREHAVYMLTSKKDGLQFKVDYFTKDGKAHANVRSWPDRLLQRTLTIERDRRQAKVVELADFAHVAIERVIDDLLAGKASDTAKTPRRDSGQPSPPRKGFRPGFDGRKVA